MLWWALKGLHRLRFQACGGAPFALRVCSSCLSLQWILFISAKKKKNKSEGFYHRLPFVRKSQRHFMWWRELRSPLITLCLYMGSLKLIIWRDLTLQNERLIPHCLRVWRSSNYCHEVEDLLWNTIMLQFKGLVVVAWGFYFSSTIIECYCNLFVN